MRHGAREEQRSELADAVLQHLQERMHTPVSTIRYAHTCSRMRTQFNAPAVGMAPAPRPIPYSKNVEAITATRNGSDAAVITAESAHATM
jgi:hypothetical protein